MSFKNIKQLIEMMIEKEEYNITIKRWMCNDRAIFTLFSFATKYLCRLTGITNHISIIIFFVLFCFRLVRYFCFDLLI